MDDRLFVDVGHQKRMAVWLPTVEYNVVLQRRYVDVEHALLKHVRCGDDDVEAKELMCDCVKSMFRRRRCRHYLFYEGVSWLLELCRRKVVVVYDVGCGRVGEWLRCRMNQVVGWLDLCF